jgi:tetratricopeptide (TPR) repeat protein
MSATGLAKIRHLNEAGICFRLRLNLGEKILAKSLLSACVLLLAFATGARADGYRDFNAGAAASARSDRTAAIKLLSVALGDADLPAHLLVPAYLARGNNYLEQGQYDSAIADFTAAIRARPDRADTWLDRCAGYAAKGMFPEAVADCSSAIQLQPQNWQIHNFRNSVYIQMGKYDDAIADYTPFIAARPKDADLLLGRSDLFQRKGDFDKAIADADAAGDISPRWASPYDRMGKIYFTKGDFPKALDNFDSAIDRWRDGADGYVVKGQTLWAMGRFDDAASSFKDSLERSNLQLFAFIWLAMSQSRQNAKVPEDIAARFAKANLSVWPGPLVQLFLGKVTPDSLLELKGKDSDTGEDMQCTVDFFVGEWQQMQGNVTEARRLLQASASVCSVNFATHQLATVDLARLH